MLFPPGPLSTPEGREGNSIPRLVLYPISPRPSQYALWRNSGSVNACPCRLAGLSNVSGWPGEGDSIQKLTLYAISPRPLRQRRGGEIAYKNWFCMLFPPGPLSTHQRPQRRDRHTRLGAKSTTLGQDRLSMEIGRGRPSCRSPPERRGGNSIQKLSLYPISPRPFSPLMDGIAHSPLHHPSF